MGVLGSGSQRITADGILGSSGKPLRVYNLTWLSTGTAGYVGLRNGTTTADDLYYYKDGTASKSYTENFDEGLLFPAGCFCDIDENVLWVVAEISKEA